MAEVLGLVASVVQLAGAGLKLSQTLYQYADVVATADRRIKDVANEVKLTSLVIQELGAIFEKGETANLISENAVNTANETIKECLAVFTEIEVKINKSKTGKMGRLMLPFRDNKIELLRSQIDKLKSTLELLMQVLIHAHQVSSEKYNREAEAKHREEIKQLLENKKQATKKYEDSLRNLSISDGSTAVDDGERSLQDKDEDEEDHETDSSSGMFNAASAIGSTVNAETLETCVGHVRSLLADIKRLQLALAENVNGDDHSDQHQKAIGSYFIARTHLDSVLLGKSQANVSGTHTQGAISATSTKSTVSYLQQSVTAHTTNRTPSVRRSSITSAVIIAAEEMERDSLVRADKRSSRPTGMRGFRQSLSSQRPVTYTAEKRPNPPIREAQVESAFFQLEEEGTTTEERPEAVVYDIDRARARERERAYWRENKSKEEEGHLADQTRRSSEEKEQIQKQGEIPDLREKICSAQYPERRTSVVNQIKDVAESADLGGATDNRDQVLSRRRRRYDPYDSTSSDDTSETGDASWDYIEEIENVALEDEVDELLREWTTLRG